MVETQAVLDAQPKNLICNFRAPNLAEFQRWKVYVQWAKDNGMDVCHLTLSLTDFFMKGIEGQLRFAMENRSLIFSKIMFFSIKFPSPAENHTIWVV
jgi:hypothetical protein